MSDFKFTYDPKELDRLIIEEDKGATFSIPESQRLEMRIRRKQLEAQRDGTDEEEDDEYNELIEQRGEINEIVRASHRPTDVKEAAFRKLPEHIQRQLEEDMKVSIVRNDASSSYNKTDEELFGDREKQSILQKLSRIRNIYYDPISFRAAMLVIKEAIEYSLKHDYPWYRTQEEVFADFNAGKIKYLGNIPKLYLGFGTNQVTDPQILAGIVSGEIQVVDRDDEEKKLKQKKKKRQYTPVHRDYDVVTTAESQYYSKLHNQGLDTPIGHILKSKSALFDRLSIPFSFAPQTNTQQQNIETFNWLRDGAGEEFYCLKNNIPYRSTRTLIDEINKENDGELNQTLATNMQQFVYEFAHPQQTQSISTFMQPAVQQQDEKVKALETGILDAIRRSNPNM